MIVVNMRVISLIVLQSQQPHPTETKNGKRQQSLPGDQPQQEERPGVRHGEGSGDGRLHRPADCGR